MSHILLYTRAVARKLALFVVEDIEEVANDQIVLETRKPGISGNG